MSFLKRVMKRDVYKRQTYDYYTTVKGIFEKVKEHAGDIDFAVQPELLSLLSSGDFGRYANAQGDMNVCFISNNCLLYTSKILQFMG